MTQDSGLAPQVDVLVVGAGPTGLAMAAQVSRHGATVRVIDAAEGPARQSRAFGVQPRSLEILRPLGVTEKLVEQGQVGLRLAVHGSRRTAYLPLFDRGLKDTAYPFILFVPQSETEAALTCFLTDHGVILERGRRYLAHETTTGGVVAHVDGPDGPGEIAARFLVGSDGVRSQVRRSVGVQFAGHRHQQRFLLADLDLHGDLDRGCVHAWFSSAGMLLLFPIAAPATWRLVTTLAEDEPAAGAVDRVLDRHSGGALEAGSSWWTSEFRVAARQARHYRSGPVFLAGDAAHVHSPAGGQGMNTGLQDAWNLGWKLALVARGNAAEALLDTYESERLPVGRGVVDLTDRLFRVATSPRWGRVRADLAPHVLGALAHLPQRTAGFRTMGQLAYHYRTSPLSTDESDGGGGLRAGDRLPDLPVSRVGTGKVGLHQLTQEPGFHLVVCGSGRSELLPSVLPGVSNHLITGWQPGGSVIVVRPDGHIGYLGHSVVVGRAYLSRWLRG